MTDGSDLGSWDEAPETNETGASWELWRNITEDNPGFGDPEVFAGNVQETKCESFTVTLHNTDFFEHIVDFTDEEPGDRPAVVPESSNNLAFLGQYAELDRDVVFTVEYSVRTAMTAVYDLLDLDEETPPVSKHYRKPGVLADASFVAIPRLFDVPFDSLTSVGLTILFNAAVFGGAHLYLALRGDGDGLPVRGRWRTVALVGGLAALAFLTQVLFRLTDLPNRWISLPAIGLGIAGVAAYWYLEARDGYRNARPTDQGAT